MISCKIHPGPRPMSTFLFRQRLVFWQGNALTQPWRKAEPPRLIEIFHRLLYGNRRSIHSLTFRAWEVNVMADDASAVKLAGLLALPGHNLDSYFATIRRIPVLS